MSEYPPYLCPLCDEMHDYLTEKCPYEEDNSDGEQNFYWGDEGDQHELGEETLDMDHYYGDEIQCSSDDDGLGELEISFTSTIDLTMDEDIDLNLRKIRGKGSVDDDGPKKQLKRQKQ
ncbi:hypothetical protein DAPPUDRAFT_333605 [Daphnia pulex]|uniref:Uncharacterized protein n=1 Tax=Daphnia pulex TaxID=6669 RepID=E9HTB2_DAPPU|nr:hypothetical protein DAPPUDRAFT_333605 [Daphnia pulex]|eukprot:EFX65024.1 hypothetical protein DAPPUDRAFT_333605 [Daphnia pulex]